MNSVSFSGYISEDPELKLLGTKKTHTARISIIVMNGGKCAPGFKYAYPLVDFYGARADWAVKYLKKGEWIEIQGEVRTNRRKGEGGKSFYETTFIANNVNHPKANLVFGEIFDSGFRDAHKRITEMGMEEFEKRYEKELLPPALPEKTDTCRTQVVYKYDPNYEAVPEDYEGEPEPKVEEEEPKPKKRGRKAKEKDDEPKEDFSFLPDDLEDMNEWLK